MRCALAVAAEVVAKLATTSINGLGSGICENFSVRRFHEFRETSASEVSLNPSSDEWGEVAGIFRIFGCRSFEKIGLSAAILKAFQDTPPDTAEIRSMTAFFRDASTLVSMRPGYSGGMKAPIPLRPSAPHSSVDSLYRAAWAVFAGRARGVDPAEELVARYRDDEGAAALVQRATVTPGTTGSGGWGGHVVRVATGEFLADLAGRSAVGGLIQMADKPAVIPAGAPEVRLYFPQRSTGPVARPWVAEDAPIPAASANLETLTLTVGKLGCIFVGSREIVKRANGEATFRQILKEDAAKSLDTVYLSDDAATDDSSAGLLYGVSGRATTGNLLDDLQDLAMAVSAGGSGKVAFITSPGRAAALGLRADITATILPSLAVSDDRIVAVDPRGIVHGFGVEPDLSASTEGVVHMSDTPLPIRDGTTADPVTSLFQIDAIGFRMLLDVAFVKRRANSVAYMDGLYAW